ncbi:MAG: single-stranded-DNA-specific exonuclease RecJ [Sarcina sp.]
MVKESWILKNNNEDIEKISKEYKISKQISKLMVNRGIRTSDQINSYINASYETMHNGNDMKDMKKAVAIVIDKIKSNLKVRIIGDYDVDGVISVYILYSAFKELGCNVDYEIPDRIKDGYGINENIIKAAYDDGVDTIITCDNGIAAIEQIKYAKSLGMTVIVTDHHDIAFIESDNERIYILPPADAILNPKQEECKYKFKKICGAGVAFKLINKLFVELGKTEEESYKYIEYLAIATVCDVVELTDENRVFVKKGLELIENSKNIGLNALKVENDLDEKEISSYHLGFVIGPCINAAGRLDTAKKGLELLLERDFSRAIEQAKEIVNINSARKEMTQKGQDKCIELIENSEIKNDKVIVVYEDSIHESIAGIIAGRIKEKYNKPTIVLTLAHEGAKGSGRSIEEYNMFEGINECKEYLTKFGGHPMAAGMSIPIENISGFRKMINKRAKLTDDDLTKKVKIDLNLPIDNITMNMINEITILEPFGSGNSKPIFGAKSLKILSAKILGKNQNVLRLSLHTGRTTMTAILFSRIDDFENLIKKEYGEKELSKLYFGGSQNINMDFLFYPSVNEWNGNKNIQIVVSNFRVCK